MVKSCRDFSQLSLISHIQILPLPDTSVHVVGITDYSNDGRLDGQGEFFVVCVYYLTDSVPPDNPCPIRFLWRSMTHVHVIDHAGVTR